MCIVDMLTLQYRREFLNELCLLSRICEMTVLQRRIIMPITILYNRLLLMFYRNASHCLLLSISFTLIPQNAFSLINVMMSLYFHCCTSISMSLLCSTLGCGFIRCHVICYPIILIFILILILVVHLAVVVV